MRGAADLRLHVWTPTGGGRGVGLSMCPLVKTRVRTLYILKS